MKNILGCVLGFVLISSSAHAMGVTRSRSMPVTGLEVSSPVELKDTNGNPILLTNLNTVEKTANGITQAVTLSSLHVSFDGFPRANYYLELNGKGADGKDVAILFRLADKVPFDSNEYPILPSDFINPSTTQQNVGIQVVLSQPGQWSTPVTHTEYQGCERETQQFVCWNQGPREVCGWQTVMTPGQQEVQITSSNKVDGYTINLKSGDRGNAAKISYAQTYTNEDVQPLSPCL